MNKSNVEDEKKGLSKEGHKNELINLSASERRELVISELKRKHRVLILMRGIPLHEFREIIDRLEAVYSELESDQKNRDELDKIRRAEAEKIIIDMNARGVDIQYLNEIIVGKSESDNAKYIKDGVPWSGQGRRPDVFKGLGAVELGKVRISGEILLG
ncbi:DNA-binding protein [Aeromonas veronii]|uniref:DNA-binding protein n=1 Tax=Aeromonas veronii TaxID=654 RepID=UPI0018F1D800|nr:DNA-binding protein [Aeromonas veronii]MBJ7592923.1 DNA-binding protein [Aeromonas veronii]